MCQYLYCTFAVFRVCACERRCFECVRERRCFECARERVQLAVLSVCVGAVLCVCMKERNERSE